MVAAAAAALSAAGQAPVSGPPPSVAVFPVANLSGARAPEGVREVLAQRLAQAGTRVVPFPELEGFMSRHRVRYLAGLDARTADDLRTEMGVTAVLFPATELASQAAPPKVALFARLVSIASGPYVAWADSVGLAGDDAPGLFELGVENDFGKVYERAAGRLATSLVDFLQAGKPAAAPKCSRTFAPQSTYRSPALDGTARQSVAVLPFYSISARPNAGQLVALHFVRQLAASPRFRVVDVGAVRQQLLDARVIMDSGVSISDADTVASLLDADLVLAGRVVRYEDYDGPVGLARVEFSTVLVERKSRRVVWSSDSYNDGTDGVRWFDLGLVRTAHAMAAQMVKLTVDGIVGTSR